MTKVATCRLCDKSLRGDCVAKVATWRLCDKISYVTKVATRRLCNRLLHGDCVTSSYMETV